MLKEGHCVNSLAHRPPHLEERVLVAQEAVDLRREYLRRVEAVRERRGRPSGLQGLRVEALVVLRHRGRRQQERRAACTREARG